MDKLAQQLKQDSAMIEVDISHELETSPVAMAASPVTPIIEWNAEAAMLTSPLRKELDDLQSDIDKARKKVREDIGL